MTHARTHRIPKEVGLYPTNGASSAIRVGMVGTGMVGEYYVDGCSGFRDVDLAVCADLDAGRAEARAAEWSLEARGVDELMASPDIDVVLNLTPPRAHAAVTRAALAAGKHVFSEKPLASTVADAASLVEAAAASGLRLGCAPDTFLGPGHQTCRTLIDSGAIGRPLSATACMVARGVEDWHVTPEFLFQPGGGPLLDMGPYYVTALVHLLGPVTRVHGLARTPSAERVVSATGVRIPVGVHTLIAGLLEFAGGAIATLVLSWDGWATKQPCVEVHGDEATLVAPDPNDFGGSALLRGAAEEWITVPPAHGQRWERGAGLADLAHALRTGEPHRTAGELALHVTDVLSALDRASEAGQAVNVETTCARPAPLPPDLLPRTTHA